MNKNTTDKKQPYSKKKIDWLKLFRTVWASRKLILKVCSIGAVIGIIIALGTPKEYTAKIFIAPESTRRSSFSGMDALADMAGVDSKSLIDRDAIYPSLYPKIINSTPFLIRLFDIKVREEKDTAVISLSRYIKERQKYPWWSAITSAPSRLFSRIISLFRGKSETENRKSQTDFNSDSKNDIFLLTREEAGIAGAIASRINVGVDKEKRTITLFVTMQDPLVAATVVDTLSVHLRKYITEYRTNKARRILEYYKKMCKDAQTEYYTTQEKYTRYADANRNLAMLTSRAELSRLRSEMSLAFSTYNQLELQVQAAQARVEKVTPVYAVIQPAIVPIAPSKPRKILILAGCILLSAITSIAWVLYVKDFIHLLIRVKNKNIR